MKKNLFWLSISCYVLVLIWTIYYYAIKYTGGFADIKDTVLCGAVGIICLFFIIKKSINFFNAKDQ